MVKKVLILFILVMFTLSLPAVEDREEEEPQSMFTEEIEVIGEVALNKSVQSVTLYKMADYENLSQEGLKSLLNRTAGYLTLSGGHYGQFTYSFARGAAVNQTLYLIDGFKITDPSNSLGLNLSFVSPAMIERAEIVRGPLSSRYGSNAMGGVVNLKPRTKEGIEASAFLGSHGSYEANVYLSRKLGVFHLSFNGFLSQYSDSLDNDEFKNSGITARLGYQRDKLKSALIFFGSFADSGIPLNMGLPTPNRTYKQDNLIVGLPFSYTFSDTTALDIKLSHNVNKYEFSDPDDLWLPFYVNRSTNNEAVLTLETRLLSRLNLDMGFDYSDQKIINEDNLGTPIDREKTSYFSAFLNTGLDLNDLFITASIRCDKYKGIDARWSPQLGFSYLIGHKFKIRGSYAHSFRAPTLPELLNPGWGNPDLEPEIGKSFEIGSDIFLKSLSLSIVYFNSRYENLIGYSPITWKFANLNEARISGIELSADIKLLENVDLTAAYTYLDTHDLQYDRELLRRPRHSFSLIVAYDNPHFNISGEMIYVGERLDYNELDWLNPIADNPAFNTFNFNLQVPINEKLWLIGKVTNAFDKEYQEVFGYPAPGSRFMAGIKFRIK
jgi:vitamin B12 transporter